MAPRCIRVTELAELLGVSAQALAVACREAGIPLVQIRRVILEQPGRKGGPLYLPIEAAVQVTERILARKCDRRFARLLRARVRRQDQAFGGARTETLLAS